MTAIRVCRRRPTGYLRGESEHEQEQEQECSNYVPASFGAVFRPAGHPDAAYGGDAPAAHARGTMAAQPRETSPVGTTEQTRNHVIAAFPFLYLFVFRFSSDLAGRDTLPDADRAPLLPLALPSPRA